ncbi:hypothetical protein BYT27DRAFT_7226924 [Phlegmacium glaucopus]|nr:hypothetical protein BYT27DRAFT_7226924 [Phlegmacium glaucopus]
MKSQTNLFALLQKEFCPPLDSSLIAALLVELESDADGNTISPSQNEIDNLYATCGALALQADESQHSEFSESDILQTSKIDETTSSWTTLDYNHEQSSGSGSASSGSSDSSQYSFGSPLGFLKAALPDVPTTRLRRALLCAEKEDIDMWDIIAGVLTEESILEMEERGLDGLEEGEGVLFLGGINFEWETVESKKKLSTKAGKKKVQPRSNTFTLGDIRQQHHTRPPPFSPKKTTDGSSMRRPTVGSTADPWTQISSLSTHIASLLPPHPPSFFQSFFHSPNHATSYDALRAALTSLCKSKQDADNYTSIVSSLIDILLPDNGDVDPELDARITADIRLSVAIADGRATDALDLVNVLRDLDTNPEMGLSHLLPAQTSDSKDDFKASGSRLPLPSSHLPNPSPSEVKPIIAPATSFGNKPSPYQWQVVPPRKIVTHSPNPHAHHIPAYTRDVNGIKTQRDFRKTSSEENDCKRRMAQATLKRRELLQQATRVWQKGNSKTRGGEIAQHYVERSNQYLALAKKEELNLARAKVKASRKRDSVDFHGVNVANATIIIQEILEEQRSSISQAKPLTIITGRGAHSVNKKSVLKPALRQVLHDKGWLVSEWNAGLFVRGRRATS